MVDIQIIWAFVIFQGEQILELELNDGDSDLFCDPDFPADDSSLYITIDKDKPSDIKWLRPKVREERAYIQ